MNKLQTKPMKRKKQSKKLAYQNMLHKILEFEIIYSNLPDISNVEKKHIIKRIKAIFA